jgi:tetraacyldisaccharide 4'-kinase
MIEYLIEFLQNDYRVAVLSRGYKRKSTGYREVAKDSTAEQVGDEPLQFKQKFPEVMVSVCADRREGIKKLMAQHAELILLDDAFQHRKVKPAFSILLTPFDDLYTNDLLLPAGNLRESARGAKRADVVIVTKCPDGVAYAALQQIQFDMAVTFPQKTFFSKIGYGTQIQGVTESLPLTYLAKKHFTLVTGIAKPKPLVDFLLKQGLEFEHKKYADHHHFTAPEIAELKKSDIILTTEKDYMRLSPQLDKFALYYLPIQTVMLNDQDAVFKEAVVEALVNFRKA